MSLRRPPLLALLLALVAVLFLYHHRHGVVARIRAALNIRPTAKALLQPGQPLPSLTLTNLAGQTKPLAAAPGRLLYLNVFATWCPDCQKETPALEQLARSAAATRRLDVVGVSQMEDLDVVSEFAQNYGLTYPIFLDPLGSSKTLMDVRFIPTSFIVDDRGIVRARITGAVTLAQMQGAVDTVRRGGMVATQH